MTVRWANPGRTLVRVEDGGTVRVFPTNPGLPAWQAIAAAVAAGTLTIAAYQPPASSEG